MAAPSAQDLYDLGQYTMQARRPSLLVNEGDVTDAVISANVSMATAVIGYGAQRFQAVFLDGGSGDDLTQTAHDKGVDRDAGEFATATVTIARANALAGGGQLDAGFRVATQPDSTGSFVTFTLKSALPFGAAQLTATVDVQCTVVGKLGNVDHDTITRMLDTAFDSTLTCTNPARAAGGAETESDPDLRDRTRGYPVTLRRGTEDALILAAKLPGTGVKRASASVDPTTGIVTLYVSDEDGNSSAAMVAAVQTIIDGAPGVPAWRAAGDAVTAVGGNILAQDVTVQLVVRSGVDIASLVGRVVDAVTNAMARLAPGEILYTDLISTAVRNVDQYSIVRCNVLVPAVSIAPNANQSVRAGTVSVTG